MGRLQHCINKRNSKKNYVCFHLEEYMSLQNWISLYLTIGDFWSSTASPWKNRIHSWSVNNTSEIFSLTLLIQFYAMTITVNFEEFHNLKQYYLKYSYLTIPLLYTHAPTENEIYTKLKRQYQKFLLNTLSNFMIQNRTSFFVSVNIICC